jgi:hypothetical protein
MLRDTTSYKICCCAAYIAAGLLAGVAWICM